MLWTILLFIVILGLLVFVHELGHFLVAKRHGIRVDEFGFGFPPRIFGLKRGDTLYSLNWIPLGGFVKIKGEAGESVSDSDSFAYKSAWRKITVLIAGVMMNFLLAWVLYTIGFSIGMPQVIADDGIMSGTTRDISILITEVAENSPAKDAGLLLGDKLITVNNTSFDSVDGFITYIGEHTESPLLLQINRGDESLEVSAQPRVFDQNSKPLLGIGLSRTAIVKYSFFQAIYVAFITTVTTIVAVMLAFVNIIKDLFSGVSIANQISGPVGVAVLTNQVAKLGFIYLLNFTAVLSINLGIINILPIPALDGGRALFVIIEKLKGKPISKKIENTLHTVGFSLLILLVLFITYKDILQYGSQIWGGIRSIF